MLCLRFAGGEQKQNSFAGAIAALVQYSHISHMPWVPLASTDSKDSKAAADSASQPPAAIKYLPPQTASVGPQRIPPPPLRGRALNRAKKRAASKDNKPQGKGQAETEETADPARKKQKRELFGRMKSLLNSNPFTLLA
jgi:hypothetical protein